MLAKWKSKVKAAIKEAREKRLRERSAKHDKGSRDAETTEQSVLAADKQSDGLSRPIGLQGRKSLDTPLQGSNNLTGNAASNNADSQHADSGTILAQQQQQQQHSQETQQHRQQQQPGSSGLPPVQTQFGQQQEQQLLQQQQQQQHQLDQQHANMMAQQQQQQEQQLMHMHGDPSGTRQAGCADRGTHGVDALMQSCPASPTSAQAAAVAATAGAPGSLAAGDDPAGTGQGGAAPAAAAAAADADSAAANAVAAQHSRPDASRTPRDDELGTCPPYAAKAVWGLRYTMEDKWAAVPNMLQIPLVLTSPSKKSKAAKSSAGCGGCMIPAASKVLAKVSPSSRLANSGGSGSGLGSSSSKEHKSLLSRTSSTGLEKPSPDRQHLIGQGLGSSDEQGLAADSPQGLAVAAGEAAAAGGARAGLGPSPGMDALHYFGVFDGHGGADAAKHCAHRMHQVVCSTILSMLSPEVAAAAVVSSLARSSRHPELEHITQQDDQQQLDDSEPSHEPLKHQHHQNQQQQQQAEEQATPFAAAAAAAGAAAGAVTGNEASAASSSSSNAAAAAGAAAAAASQPMPMIDIAASNGSWLLPALSRSFVSLDNEFGVISEGSYVGSTAVVTLVGSTRLWVAHCGDSRAVLGRGGAVQVLTSDHKASRDDEVARVQAAGGHVWWDRVMGELAVSRAIGDHCLRPYVIPEPELLMLERSADDEVLVMASDGLWDVMNNQEVVDMALHSLQAAQASGHAGVAAVKRSANSLTKAALERGTRDNVTVLVVDLRPRKPGTYEAVVAASSSRHSSSSGYSSRRHSSSRSKTSSSSSSRRRVAAAAAAASGMGDGAAAPAAVTPAGEGAVGGHTSGAAAGSPAAAAAAAGTSVGAVSSLERAPSGCETRALMQQHAVSSGAGT